MLFNLMVVVLVIYRGGLIFFFSIGDVVFFVKCYYERVLRKWIVVCIRILK